MNEIRIEKLSIGRVLKDIDLTIPAGACAGIIGMPYLPEGAPLDPGIPVARWIEMARHLPDWEPDVANDMLRDFELPLKTPVDRLSMGQRVRLGVLLTLGRKAPVYLLDDPDGALRERIGAACTRCEPVGLSLEDLVARLVQGAGA